jgi:hypothetical protein
MGTDSDCLVEEFGTFSFSTTDTTGELQTYYLADQTLVSAVFNVASTTIIAADSGVGSDLVVDGSSGSTGGLLSLARVANGTSAQTWSYRLVGRGKQRVAA